MINIINKTTFAKFGIEFNKTFTSFFIEGIALIVLKGLRILRALIPRMEADLKGKNSIIDRMTTMKSRIFQPSLRYEFSCITNPLEMIFKMASMMNTQLKKIPK